MSRPSLYLTLLRRNLGEGHSWVEASDRALAGVAHAYDLVKQAVLGPPALRSSASPTSVAEQPEDVTEGEVDGEVEDDVDYPVGDVIDAETVDELEYR